MKKLVIAIAALLVTVGLVSWKIAENGGATNFDASEIPGGGCSVFQADGTISARFESGRNIITSGGVITATCKGQVQNNTGKVIRIEGSSTSSVPCRIFVGQGAEVSTTDFQQIITPSGQATLICRFRQ
jgi:hypothetical protein